MIEAKETLSGSVNSSSSLTGVVNNAIEYIKPITQEKSVMPNIEEQVIVPDEGFNGLSKVVIEPVALQNKETTPNEEEQTIKADDDFVGLQEVRIKAIPSEYKKPSGTKDITSNGTHDVAQYENVNVDVPQEEPNLQWKEVTPAKEVRTAIPDYGYDGLSKVTVNPIPDDYIKPTGSMIITKNGEYDVSLLSSVTTDVHESAGEQQYFTTLSSAGSSDGSALYKSVIDIPSGTKITNGKYQFYGCTSLIKVPLLDYSTLTDCTCMFRGCTAMVDTSGAKNFKKITNAGSMFYGSKFQNIDMSSWIVTNLTTTQYMFNENSNLVSINISNWNVTKDYFNMTRMFYQCYKLTSIISENTIITGKITADNMFYNCYNLIELDLSWLHGTGNYMPNMFYKCRNLEKIDLRNLDISVISSSSSYKGMFEEVPTSCEIIVMNDACKTWMTTNFPTMANVKTVAELG